MRVIRYGRYGRVYLYGQIPHHCFDVYMFRARPASAFFRHVRPFAGRVRAGDEFEMKPPFYAHCKRNVVYVENERGRWVDRTFLVHGAVGRTVRRWYDV